MSESMRPSIPYARIFQINVSNGGVPKLALPIAEITVNGLAGDRQRDVEVPGGPERAVCLYSLESILALQAEGHPIYPGAVGENVTLVGLDWEQIIPGARLRLGPTAMLEVTRYTSPCSNIAPYFAEGYFNRISQKLYPGWSRAYARVLETGTIRVGDAVEIVTPG